MRIGLHVAQMLLSWIVATCFAGDPPQNKREAEPLVLAAQKALREASELAIQQDDQQRHWAAWALLRIGEVQIRAGDCDAALRSIRASADSYGRNQGLLALAKALARNGNRERAFDVLSLLGSDHGWHQDTLEDEVQLRWVEHLLAATDLARAGNAIEQLKVARNRAHASRTLGVAYATSGDPTRAAQQFTRAISEASGLEDEFHRANALCEIADAQLSIGLTDAAKATIRLLDAVEVRDPLAKALGLLDHAVLVAKMNDAQGASQLFRRAIEAQKAVDATNSVETLKRIAVAQAGVGYVHDALKTASMIEHSERDFTRDGDREEALRAIAIAQIQTDDTEGAVRTALAVKHFLQYRDDPLQDIVAHQIMKERLKTALTTAERVHNPSRKAIAKLKVATAYAKSCERGMAADVAAQIELTNQDGFPGIIGEKRFDFRLPQTWGVCYDDDHASTALSRHVSVLRAAELAGAAMTLSQALGQKPGHPYSVLFNEIPFGEIIRSLARAHAASGDADEALAWAKQIGSGVKINANDDLNVRWAVERRVYALIGVAEGALDRSNDAPPKAR